MGMIMHDDVPYGEGTSYTQGTGIAINNNVIAVDADNTPTEGSEKPVKSKGVYSALESNSAKSASLLKSTVGWTGKNLLKRTSNSNITVEGITFTVNADNSITCNGTSTNGLVWIIESVLGKANVEYILTGCPSGGGSKSTDYWLGAYINGTIDKRDIGNGVLLKYDTDTTIEVRLRIPNGYTANNFTFYPMLRDASISDDTYEPYHESVETMYEEEIHGVNLLKNEATTQTINGVTFTVNSDGSITANGTASATADIVINQGFQIAEKCIMNGCPIGGGSSTYRLMYTSYGGEGIEYADTGNGVEINNISILTNPYVRVVFRVSNGTTVNNIKIYPLVRKAAIEDSTYRPYNEQAIQNQLNNQTGVLGVKNLMHYPYNELKTSVDVTLTVDSDGVINLNGTQGSSAQGQYYLSRRFNYDFQLPAGTYKLTGGSTDTWLDIGVNKVTGDASQGSTTLGQDRGNGFTFTLDKLSDVQVILFIDKNKTFSNKKIYPMLRLASDPDDTYVPYAMTNRELTDAAVVEDISSAITLNSEQTAYEVTSFKVARLGKLVMINGSIKSLTENAVPSGRSYAQIASGLPRPLWNANYMIQPAIAGNQAQALIVGNNSVFQLRGGTTNAVYDFTITYLSV